MTSRLLLALVFIPMLIEARLAAVNERAQLARGGVEPPRRRLPDHAHRLSRLCFSLMIVEGVFWPGHGYLLAGLALFAASKALKWWAIASLGAAWTFRVIVRPGMPLVRTGPYRWLRHPNYVAVAGELVGLALMSGARVAGPIGTAYFAVLMLRRISVEERALNASRRAGRYKYGAG